MKHQHIAIRCNTQSNMFSELLLFRRDLALAYPFFQTLAQIDDSTGISNEHRITLWLYDQVYAVYLYVMYGDTSGYEALLFKSFGLIHPSLEAHDQLDRLSDEYIKLRLTELWYLTHPSIPYVGRCKAERTFVEALLADELPPYVVPIDRGGYTVQVGASTTRYPTFRQMLSSTLTYLDCGLAAYSSKDRDRSDSNQLNDLTDSDRWKVCLLRDMLNNCNGLVLMRPTSPNHYNCSSYTLKAYGSFELANFISVIDSLIDHTVSTIETTRHERRQVISIYNSIHNDFITLSIHLVYYPSIYHILASTELDSDCLCISSGGIYMSTRFIHAVGSLSNVYNCLTGSSEGYVWDLIHSARAGLSIYLPWLEKDRVYEPLLIEDRRQVNPVGETELLIDRLLLCNRYQALSDDTPSFLMMREPSAALSLLAKRSMIDYTDTLATHKPSTDSRYIKMTI